MSKGLIILFVVVFIATFIYWLKKDKNSSAGSGSGLLLLEILTAPFALLEGCAM